MRLDAVASAARACASTNVAECGVESNADDWLSERRGLGVSDRS